MYQQYRAPHALPFESLGSYTLFIASRGSVPLPMLQLHMERILTSLPPFDEISAKTWHCAAALPKLPRAAEQDNDHARHNPIFLSSFLWRSHFLASEFRYCPLCLQHGFHSYLHQLRFVAICPLHQCELLRVCVSCGSPAVIRRALPANELYECHACRHTLFGAPLSAGDLRSARDDPAGFEAAFEPLYAWCSRAYLKSIFLTPATTHSHRALMYSALYGLEPPPMKELFATPSVPHLAVMTWGLPQSARHGLAAQHRRHDAVVALVARKLLQWEKAVLEAVEAERLNARGGASSEAVKLATSLLGSARHMCPTGAIVEVLDRIPRTRLEGNTRSKWSRCAFYARYVSLVCALVWWEYARSLPDVLQAYPIAEYILRSEKVEYGAAVFLRLPYFPIGRLDRASSDATSCSHENAACRGIERQKRIATIANHQNSLEDARQGRRGRNSLYSDYLAPSKSALETIRDRIDP